MMLFPGLRKHAVNIELGGGFKYFLFSSLFGEMIQFDKIIFQMGSFNHQPEKFAQNDPHFL